VFERRVSVIVGAFGSGKTEVAVNAALAVSGRGEAVTLVDLDVVKPYFRSRALQGRLARHGIPVAAPQGDHPFPEVPIALSQVAGLLLPGRPKVIVDVGGDPVGSLAIGALSGELPPAEVEQLLVLNFARPQTETVEHAVAMARAIQGAARLPVTGLVANTHLLGETTPELVLDGLRRAARTSEVLGVPLALAAVEERLLGALPPGWAPCPVLGVRRMVFPPFETPGALTAGAGRAAVLAAASPQRLPTACPGA
jgi:hypothetical protein